MRARYWPVIASAVLVAGLWFVVRDARIPLGVRGEWEWPRLKDIRATSLDAALGLVSVAMYSGFAALGLRLASRLRTAAGEAALVFATLVASIAVQAALQSSAPLGYGLGKWATLGMRGSSGYLHVAGSAMDDPRFLAAYPRWIAGQGSLHIGTHPPGLFLVSRGALVAMRQRPATAQAIERGVPTGIRATIRAVVPRSSIPERAAMILIAALTWILGAAAVIPLYLLARAYGTPGEAFAAAALWPLVPAEILFQPTADAAFPFLSCSALAACVWAVRGHRSRAIAGGVLLGVGTSLSLAFFPIGLVAAIVFATARGVTWRRRAILFALTGAGFLALTCAAWSIWAANPFAIWAANASNHAGFYAAYPRSLGAWCLINPVELAVAIGLPTACLFAGAAAERRVPPVSWATLAVLVLLTLSGRNLSEVARLWLPFYPALVVAAGRAEGVSRPVGLAAATGLLGLQTLMLQSMIQVVYPA